MTNPHTATTRLVIEYTDRADLLRQVLLILQRERLSKGVATLYDGGTRAACVGLTLDPLEEQESEK